MYEPDRVADDRVADDSHHVGPADRSTVRQRIESQLTRLDDIDSKPLAEHADVYQGIHAQLQDALAEIENS
jgi:hypothetical protein